MALAATVGPSVTVTGPSPFASCTDGLSVGPPPGEVFVNAEVEPFLSVNPTNPNNVVGVWQQDRWTDGGSHGNGTGYTTTNPLVWTQATPIP